MLSSEEVVHLLEAAPGPKYNAALGVAYGAGLRVTILTPALLARVVDMIDHVPMEDRDTKGDLYDRTAPGQRGPALNGADRPRGNRRIRPKAGIRTGLLHHPSH